MVNGFKKRIYIVIVIALFAITAILLNLNNVSASTTNEYQTRFNQMYSKIHDSNNGYFSSQGIPYHSVETLICEAPDYGHETTSEAFSYYMWLEALNGKFSGNWSGFTKSWNLAEKYIIPSSDDQIGIGKYDASKPATYVAEQNTPDKYPSPLDSNVPSGIDPINGDLKNAYGSDNIYGMHWIIDTDNWFGYGQRGDGKAAPSYMNTFQRGAEESIFETVPHPSWDAFKWGGTNGFVDLFVKDSNPAKQWRYTNAPDADARAVQATYWANKWSGAQVSSEVAKSSKMGDYLRYAMFDKYFKPIGAQSTSSKGTGYDSAHYLMSWYYSWGGGLDGYWAWKIGSSHNHFGYQNPMTAWVLSTQNSFKPKSQNGSTDWAKSLDRQLEFYAWLQSSEGAIAGGATNSWNGRYEAYPAGTSTFYGMAYEPNPVYHDPGSNTWIGFQAWSMQRVAELYYETKNAKAKAILDKWVKWIKSATTINSDGTFSIPSELDWSGQPDTWSGTPSDNSNLHVTVKSSWNDLGVASALANTLSYYAKASGDSESQKLAKDLLDGIWNNYRDDKGISLKEVRKDYKRFFEQEVYVPSGWSGKMPNGDVIKPGIKFIDIRSNYKKDPSWSTLENAYKTGNDPSFVYHRFWVESEFAIANGVYSILFENASTPTSSITSTNSPTTKPTTPTATPTPIVTDPTSTMPNTTSPTSGITATYKIANSWTSGATIDITLKNSTSSDKKGWLIKFNFNGDEKVLNAWSTELTQTGTLVQAKNGSGNETIQANGSTSMGFNLSFTDSTSIPKNITVE